MKDKSKLPKMPGDLKKRPGKKFAPRSQTINFHYKCGKESTSQTGSKSERRR
jgi:hypothetical protein